MGLEPDWELVPQRRIPFNDLIATLPEPTTLPPPTLPPTTQPPPAKVDPSLNNAIDEEGEVERILTNSSVPVQPVDYVVPPAPEGPSGTPPPALSYPEPTGVQPEPSAYPESDEILQRVETEPEPTVQSQREGLRGPAKASGAGGLVSSLLASLSPLLLVTLLR